MNPSTGQLAFIFIAALLLACASAWVLAWRYRTAMRRLMSAPMDGGLPAGRAALAAAATSPAAASVSLADNRRAALRLTLLLTGLSCLIAISGAVIWLRLSFPDQPFASKRAAVLALMHLWPLVPVLGLLWRWSLPRLLGALALFCVLCFAVMWWRSIERQPVALALGLAVEIGPALAMVALVFVGSATRAVAPWLLRCSSGWSGPRCSGSTASRRWSNGARRWCCGCPRGSARSAASWCSRCCHGCSRGGRCGG